MHPQSTGKRIRLTDRDLLWMQKIHEHGPLCTGELLAFSDDGNQNVGRAKNRLTDLWDFEKYSSPFKRGGRYYFYKNDGLQNQSVLHVQRTLEDEPSVLIDPNKWSDDGTVAMAGSAFSDDGKYLAYGVQESGSDWRTWRVMEIATRKVLDDEIKWVK